MGQCKDDIKIPFPVVHSILIRRKCISCIIWLLERQIRVWRWHQELLHLNLYSRRWCLTLILITLFSFRAPFRYIRYQYLESWLSIFVCDSDCIVWYLPWLWMCDPSGWGTPPCYAWGCPACSPTRMSCGRARLCTGSSCQDRTGLGEIIFKMFNKNI